MVKVLPLALTFAILSSPGASAQAPASPPQPDASAGGNAQRGKDLFVKYSCYACHGYDGHGGAGARLVPMRMSLAAFTAYVHNPRQMPPYTAKVLSDAQLADLFAHVKSLPASPAARSIQLLTRIIGEKE
jgi:ubiquinol-cytochrome c reductase cytochrome c subunit